MLGTAVAASALLYFNPAKMDMVKTTLNLPKGMAFGMLSNRMFYTWVDAHLL